MENIIFKKADNIEISPFDDSDEFLVANVDLGYRVVVNAKTHHILSLVDGKATLKEVVENYNETAENDIELETAHKLLYDHLSKYGIIESDKVVTPRNGVASYLSLSFTLIGKKQLAFFTRLISPIMSVKYFYPVIAIGLAFVCFSLISNFDFIIENYGKLTFGSWVMYMAIIGGILFLHEFGHATACKKFGARPGAVGFGFYLLTPVMFADVSDIWKLKRSQRVIVNLAGIYMETLIAVGLTIAFMFNNSITILILSSLMIVRMLINLNPFLRYDGYWVISDMTNTPNLRSTSMNRLSTFFKSLIGRAKFAFTGKNIFLVVYAFISVIFIFVVLGFILFKDTNGLIAFPVNIYNHIAAIVSGEKAFVFAELFPFILPFLFYFIVTKFSIGFIRKKLKRQ